MREFLARHEVEHGFRDVRKEPIDAAGTVALVRRHKRGVAKKGVKLVQVEISGLSDDDVRKLFLGREGTLRAPTVSDGTTIFAGFDEATLRELAGT